MNNKLAFAGLRSLSELDVQFRMWRKQYGDIFTIHMGKLNKIMFASTAYPLVSFYVTLCILRSDITLNPLLV